MGQTPPDSSDPDRAYREAAAQFGDAIVRLAGTYEADIDRRRDLVQDIHVALWKSFAGFRQQCSVRTWVYRIGHNVATSYVLRERRAQVRNWVALEAIESLSDGQDVETTVGDQRVYDKLMALIQRLDLPDRQIMHLYLEGLDAPAIADITHSSPGGINTKLYRLRAILGRAFHQGATS